MICFLFVLSVNKFLELTNFSAPIFSKCANETIKVRLALDDKDFDAKQTQNLNCDLVLAHPAVFL
jgi:hypothetical protein